jgi:putative ATP-binding cassette transporter
VRLSYDQSDREASFRAELLHAGENAESIALLQYEGRVLGRLRTRLDALLDNMNRIVAINRNVGFFTTGYNYGIQLLPPLLVGPLFMSGKVQFGVITQSAMAFAQLLGAFSLIVNQFGSISSYAAVLVRLGAFSAALERAPARATFPAPARAGEAARLIFDDLTLYSKSTGECLLSHLKLEISTGTNLLITGKDEAQRALFRAMALGGDAAGRVICPGDQQVLFLPERPYAPPATLRELLVRSVHETELSDSRIEATLRELGLAGALQRMGGLDREGDLSHALSLGEQQLLAVARVVLAAPLFAVLHNPGAALAPDQLELALARLAAASVTCVTLGGNDAQLGNYGAVLEIDAGGVWDFRDGARSGPPSSRIATGRLGS